MKNLIKLILSLFVIFLVFEGCKTDPLKNDKLAISLTNLNNYLKEMNDKSNGGFVDKDFILKEVKVVEVEVNKRDGNEVWEIAKKVVDPDFLSSDDKPALRICLFCCTGCLDGIRRNHCITVLVWTFGPGSGC